MSKKTLVSWSTGKDCAWALHLLRQNPEFEVVGLFCSINKVFNRVALHGVRTELLKQQAKCIGLPLEIIDLPYPCTDEDYISAMTAFMDKAQGNGIECLAFGDLFLQSVRDYREAFFLKSKLIPIFPIWGMSTEILSKEMLSSGLKAIITCVDSQHLTKDFSGRTYDDSFLGDLPGQVDPCGENGEFHSFVFDGPMFQQKLNLSIGETLLRNRVYFTDLLPLE